MRKVILVLLAVMLIAFPLAFSQQLFIGNYHGLTWDLRPIPSYAIQTYELCIWDKQGEGEPIVVGETGGATFTVDISEYDFEVTFGVRTVWVLTEDQIVDFEQRYAGDRLESEWNFSDVNGESTPNPFVALRGVLAPDGFEHVQ